VGTARDFRGFFPQPGASAFSRSLVQLFPLPGAPEPAAAAAAGTPVGALSLRLVLSLLLLLRLPPLLLLVSQQLSQLLRPLLLLLLLLLLAPVCAPYSLRTAPRTEPAAARGNFNPTDGWLRMLAIVDRHADDVNARLEPLSLANCSTLPSGSDPMPLNSGWFFRSGRNAPARSRALHS
jgi:hypothetical protein